MKGLSLKTVGQIVTILVTFVINVALYLPFLRVEHWTSFRTMLPTLPLLFVLGAAVTDTIWWRWISPRRHRLAAGLSR